MGSAYTIFGRQVQPHILALLTLGSVAGFGVLATRGGKSEQQQAPPANNNNNQQGQEINVEQAINDFINQKSQEKN